MKDDLTLLLLLSLLSMFLDRVLPELGNSIRKQPQINNKKVSKG